MQLLTTLLPLLALIPTTLSNPLPQEKLGGPGKIDCIYWYQAKNIDDRNLIAVNALFDCLQWGGRGVNGQSAIPNVRENQKDGTQNHWSSSCYESSRALGETEWIQKKAIGGKGIIKCINKPFVTK